MRTRNRLGRLAVVLALASAGCGGGELVIGAGGGAGAGGNGGSGGAEGGAGGAGGGAAGAGGADDGCDPYNEVGPGSRLVVAGTFGGTLSATGVDGAIEASTDSDAFAFAADLWDGTSGPRLFHVVAGRTTGLRLGSYYYESRFVCGEFEGTIDVQPGTPAAWSVTSEGGRDVFCAYRGGPFLVAGPGEERLGELGRPGTSSAGPGVIQPSGFILVGAASEAAAIVRGTIRSELPASRGGLDALVAEFSPSCELWAATTFGGPGDDVALFFHSENAPDYDYEVVGVFGGGEPAASATFGNVTVTSNGGVDVFLAEVVGDGDAVAAVITGGGPGDDAVSRLLTAEKRGAGGSSWTTHAWVAGSYESAPFDSSNQSLSSDCAENAFVMALELPTTSPSVPALTSLVSSCNVAITGWSGSVVAGDHRADAVLDLGSGPTALVDPPAAGGASFVGSFDPEGGAPWLTRLISDGSIHIADLCPTSSPGSFDGRHAAIGWFTGTAVFAAGTPEQVTLEAQDVDGFVLELDEQGKLVNLVHLSGPGDQRAQDC